MALLGLTVVAFIGIVMFEGLAGLTGPVDGVVDVVLWLLCGLQLSALAAAPIGYLYRHRRPEASE